MNSTRPGISSRRADEQLGGRRQHRRVRVVPAGVHRSSTVELKSSTGVLVQRQRVHVAPQQHRRARLAAGQQGGDTRRRLVQRDVERQAVERLEHHLAGRRQVVADLGMTMQPATQRHRLVVQVTGFVAQRVERHAADGMPGSPASPCDDRSSTST